MCALKSTTLTCLLDDPTMSTAFSEFLLQIQSGLPQGSLRTGLSVPSGSILMSTNSIESERYYCMYTVRSLETILMNACMRVTQTLQIASCKIILKVSEKCGAILLKSATHILEKCSVFLDNVSQCHVP